MMGAVVALVDQLVKGVKRRTKLALPLPGKAQLEQCVVGTRLRETEAHLVAQVPLGCRRVPVLKLAVAGSQKRRAVD